MAAVILCDTLGQFNSRKKEAETLGCNSLNSLLFEIEKYESKGFCYVPKVDELTGADISGTRTSLGGYLTIPECEMILRKPVVGNTRHREAHDSLTYIKLKNFYQELTGTDEHNLFVPA